MPPETNDNGQDVTWFDSVERVEEPELDDDIDLENYELATPEVTFEESIEAIEGEALSMQDLLGFNDISRKQVHELRSHWNELEETKRATIAEVMLALAGDYSYGDFGRFFQVLLEDSNEIVRLHAANGAALSEVPTLIKPLVELSENDPSENVREATLRALAPQVVGLDLGVVNDAQDEKRLMKLKSWAQDESWPANLRAAALQSYSYNVGDDDIGAIIESFVESDDDTLQLGAMRAMIEFGPGAFTRFLERELRSQDVDAREAAALAMGQSTDEAVVPMLTMAAREDQEPMVREAAYTALGNIGSRAAINSLTQLRENASDDEIDVIESSLQYAAELQELENLEEIGMFEFDSESDDDE